MKRAQAAATGTRERSRAAAYLEMLHLPPILVVLAAVAGFTFAASGGRPPPPRLALLLLAYLLTQLSISLHNDYCDRDLDARAKPWRAIPRGLVTPRAALGAAAVLAIAGVLVAAPLGAWVTFLVGLGAGAAWTYNAWLKRTVWTWVPFWTALPTLALAGFAVAGHPMPAPWRLYLIGGPLVLAVYLVDTLDDIESDVQHGVRGLAHRLGPRGARLACWGAAVGGIVLGFVFWPVPDQPVLPLAASIGLVGAAAGLDRLGSRRGRWLGIMAAVVVFAAAWVAAVPV